MRAIGSAFGVCAIGAESVWRASSPWWCAGPKGTTAPQAAGVIHTDFQRGFIKAEVVAFDDLVEAGSMSAAKAAGKARIEGKEYIMKDGDVVEFRFNV